MTDTIAAIATPYGTGGIGIIRLSGPAALDIATRIFSKTRDGMGRLTDPASHRVFHGYILDSGEIIDEVLLIPMRSPRSYTTEDVVEIQAHSGPVVLKQILELTLAGGARLAEPGEFTRRAFLNQRIDLTQAEAVADIIDARSLSALKFAAAQNSGVLKQRIQTLRDQLMTVLAQVEVMIDFPDDADAGHDQCTDLEGRGMTVLRDAVDQCRAFIQQYEDACFLKDGIRMVICGKPNVGKSSLMNRLLAREKAIVTPLPGTTRDPIQDDLTMNGIPFVITDTAGIHDTGDLVEIIGIERARDHIKAADLILFMVEPGSGVSKKEFEKMVPPGKKTILVINKIDLTDDPGRARKTRKPLSTSLPTAPPGYEQIPAVRISALYDRGIDTLRDTITHLCTRDLEMGEGAVIPNLRHKQALSLALSSLLSAAEGIQTRRPEETLAIDLRQGIEALGKITGETASLDILDTIFNHFCIGK